MTEAPTDLDEKPDPTLDGKGIRGALLRYRILAYTVGTLLVILVFVAVPLKYFGPPDGRLESVVGVAHGWLFMVLLITVYDLGRRVKWSWVRMLGIAASGLIPFLTFVAEYFAHKNVRGYLANLETSSSTDKS